MRKNKKNIIICSAMIIIYVIGLFTLGYQNNTIKNTKNHVELTEKPRLEDDFYNYVNYDVLSNVIIDETDYTDSWDALTSGTDKIEKEKDLIINDIVSKCGIYGENTVYDKICRTYNSLNNLNYESNKLELEKYIDLINSSNNISEYLTNISHVTNMLPNSEILFTLSFGYENDQYVYPSIDPMYYDYNDNTLYYKKWYASEYANERNLIKNTDLKLLMQYGYSEVESRKIVNDIYTMFDAISKYSNTDIDLSNLKSYSLDELKVKYNNINFDLIKGNIVNILCVDDRIVITDESQLKLINDYLINENLDILKEYALVRLLYSYGDTIDLKNTEIVFELQNKIDGTDEKFDYSNIVNDYIYEYFSDTIALEFAKKHNLAGAKKFYEEMTYNFINQYKIRIENEDWLGSETKKNAIKKLDNMGVYIMYPEEYELDELNYNISGTTFSEIDRSLSISVSNLMYSSLIENKYSVKFNTDWLDVNAYYSPSENMITILGGIVYSVHEHMGITSDTLQENYYNILGSIGYVVGHEISHAFDNTGSKYDENGKMVDWWTEEDKIAYNKRILKVEKYYDNYNQDGYQTLGENIADLGSIATIMQIAEANNASNQNYKEIFESSAKIWASQNTKFIDGYLLVIDNHSPNKNRINAVFSSIDKFYEVYNIKETDKMYVPKKDRVAVW